MSRAGPEARVVSEASKPTWVPHAGSQELFLSCPYHEVLYTGTRGPGKTDALLMDFAQDVGKGYGGYWRGILFREEATQLEDVITKAQRWFGQIFPTARYIGGKANKFRFEDGEQLLFRHAKNASDYWKYHGHEYPWIGWEELVNWPTDEVYEMMKTCCRSGSARVPRKIRATCNPYGVGHHWVKARFIDPAPPGVPIHDDNQRVRVAIHGNILENLHLMEADPEYYKSLKGITSENKRKAWLEGSWDIVGGGMFSDVWTPSRNILPAFEVPKTWHIRRAFDWGSSRPFSVGWWAITDGTPQTLPDGSTRRFPRGSHIRIGEWYGWNGRPNEGLRMLASELARGILEREETMRIKGRVCPGPADSSIFNNENGSCIADQMAMVGVRWEPSDKRPGSRKQRWELMRQMLAEAGKAMPEKAGLWTFDTCRQFIRVIPSIPRDEADLDDVDTESEDHIADETGYEVLMPRREAADIHLGGL